MCARPLACPLCSQPGFLTLDALRAGLISVATRPLICPVCNEVLLGIDKLTIHLFSHTINMNSNVTEVSKPLNVIPNNNSEGMMNDIQTEALQTWSTFQAASSETAKLQSENLFHGCSTNDRAGIELQTNLQETTGKTLKSHCEVQYCCNTAVKDLATMQNAVGAANNVECYQNDWIANLTEPHSSQRVTKDIDSVEASRPQSNITNTIDKSEDKQNLEQSPMGLSIQSQQSSSNNNIIATSSETQLICKHDETNLKDFGESATSEQASNIEILPHLKAFKILAKERTERCNICSFHFPDQNILALHKELVHVTDKKESNITANEIHRNYSCHLCSKIFKMRGSLMVHMRVAHTSYNLGTLVKHKDTIMVNNDGFNCPTCGKKFKKEQHVVQHLKTHDGKQWECDICSKMFTTKYFLKKHKRLHSGEMPYKCNICDKTFTFQQSYHKHRLYHKDDKPHTCSTCSRSFKELSTLHNHERIHTGEKPFACETCGKCFRQRVSYLVHRRIHTGAMPYKCIQCGKSFRYKVSQRTHKCPTLSEGNTQQSRSSAQNSLQTVEVRDTSNEFYKTQKVTPEQNKLTLSANNSEEHKFVLVINNEGQHILTKESDIEGVQYNDIVGTDKNSKSDMWRMTTLDEQKIKKSVDILKLQMEQKKANTDDVNDFFSMGLVHLEPRQTSPTCDLQHLKLSCLGEKQNNVGNGNLVEPYGTFKHASDSVQMDIIHANVVDNFTVNNNSMNPLQTINEASLKQLLYGIDKKVMK